MLIKEAKMALFKDNKERGWHSPSWDFKAPSLPLKSLKISVVGGPNTKVSELTQNSTKWGLSRPKSGHTPPNHKTLYINYLEGPKIELFYIIH